MRGALIHRAREIVTVAGPQNALGERTRTRQPGPWVAVRLMEIGSVAPKTPRGPDTTADRVERGYELLIDAVDLAGTPTVPPTASSVFETDCPVLGSPTVHLTGEPERLTPGTTLIGYRALATVPLDRS